MAIESKITMHNTHVFTIYTISKEIRSYRFIRLGKYKLDALLIFINEDHGYKICFTLKVLILAKFYQYNIIFDITTSMPSTNQNKCNHSTSSPTLFLIWINFCVTKYYKSLSNSIFLVYPAQPPNQYFILERYFLVNPPK